MKLLSLLFISSITLPQTTFAATQCKGISLDHNFSITQRQNNVEVVLDDENPLQYEDLDHPKEGTLEISGSTRTLVIVSNTSVDEFLKKRVLKKKLAVSMIAGRAEFDGDQDMWLSYANSFYSSLKCQ